MDDKTLMRVGRFGIIGLTAVMLIRPVQIMAQANPPDTLLTPADGVVGQRIEVAVEDSAAGHEYRFDWGVEGDTSDWGFAKRSYMYSTVDIYGVRAQSRLKSDTSIVSLWSSPADIDVAGHELQIAIVPPGSGIVTRLEDKIGYNHQEVVSLIATPMTDYAFDHWEGDIASGTNPDTTISMDSDKTVRALFRLTVFPPVVIIGPVEGKVGADLNFSVETTLPEHEYQFEWGSPTDTTDWGLPNRTHAFQTVGVYNIRVRTRLIADTTVKSNWSLPKVVNITGHILTVHVHPEGSGTVTRVPAKPQYDHEESVQLTAVPSNGFIFLHWGDDAAAGTDKDTTITMDGDKTITARFRRLLFEFTEPNAQTVWYHGDIDRSIEWRVSTSKPYDLEVDLILMKGEESIETLDEVMLEDLSYTVALVKETWLPGNDYRIKMSAGTVTLVSSEAFRIRGTLPETAEVINYPNPFNNASGGTLIEMIVDEPSSADLRIFDFAGRVVFERIGLNIEPPSMQVEWDGHDRNGNMVANGVYLCEVKVYGGGVMVRKIAVFRGLE